MVYIDWEKGKAYLIVPLVSGQTIGLDNTCKTGLELKSFFKEKGGLTSVKSAITKLEKDISGLEGLIK